MKIRRTLTGLAISLAVLAAISLVDARSNRSIQTMVDRAAEHQHAQLLLERTRSNAMDILRSERGYMVSGGDPQFLTAYTSSIRRLGLQLAELERRFHGRSDQAARMAELQQTIEGLLRISTESIALRDRRDSSARLAVLTGAERNRMDRLNALVDAMLRSESVQLAEDQNAAREAARLTSLIGLAGNSAVILIAAISFLILRREVIARTSARNEARIANDQLQARIEQIQRHSSDFSLLSEMSEMMQLSTTEVEIGHVVRRYGARMFETASGSVYSSGEGSRVVELGAFWGERPAADSFEMTDCWALRRGHTQPCSPAVHARRLELAQPQADDALLCIPLLAHGTSLGVLSLDIGSGHLSKSTQALARAFADQVALSLANVRLHESLRTRAVRDPLTGLFNRRYLEETLARELRRAERHGHKVGVLMIDADHFKRVNDEFGHAAGDAVLIRIATVLQEVTREEDIACRFGGEEFVIVLPEMNENTISTRAEEIREAVRAVHIRYHEQQIGGVTVSIGAAITGNSPISASELLAQADRALYLAKSAGRDRTVGPASIAGLTAA